MHILGKSLWKVTWSHEVASGSLQRTSNIPCIIKVDWEPLDENQSTEMVQALQPHSRLLAAREGVQVRFHVLGQSSGSGYSTPPSDCPWNWGRTAPAGGEMRGPAGRRPGKEAGFCYLLCGVHPVKAEGSLLKMQVELSSRHYLLFVLWSWVNFLQLLQETRKRPNEQEAGGGWHSSPCWEGNVWARSPVWGTWIHSWAN